MAYFWRQINFVCDQCGHSNRPARSPAVSYGLVLNNPMITCKGKGCGRTFRANVEGLLRISPLARSIAKTLNVASVATEVEKTTLATEAQTPAIAA